MANLLSEGFRRLFKGKRFYVVLCVVIGIVALINIGILLISMSFSDKEKEEITFDIMLFIMSGTMPLFMTITAGLLVVQDFRNNTVRNNIIIGHSRTSIYFTNLIITEAVAVIYLVAYWGAVLIFGNIFFRFEDFPSEATGVNMLLVLVIQLTFGCLTTFFCTTLKNVGGFVLALILHYIFSMLEIVVMFIQMKSEDVALFISTVIPSYQISTVQSYFNDIPEKLWLMLLADAVICIASTISGVVFFRKADLK